MALLQAIADLAGIVADFATGSILKFASRFVRLPESGWLRVLVTVLAYILIVIPLALILFLAIIYLLALAFGIRISFG